MALWDKDDHFGRWVHFLCAIPLIGIGAIVEYVWWHEPYYRSGWYSAGGAGMIFLGGRCLWYAITGRDNVNRDDF